MKRVLITGGAGFIGSHLARALVARGCHVHIIDNLTTGRKENIADLEGVEFFHRSATVYHYARRAMDGCDTIFHLAAVVGVNRVLEDPARCYRVNVQATDTVLEVARNLPRIDNPRVIIASSSEVYGKGTPPFSESDDLLLGPSDCPRWSYAASKIADEHLGLWYCQPRFKTRTTVCRFFNTVGPGQRGDYGMVLPRFVRWALRRETTEIYGNGRQTRCFVNVSDTVRALIALAECDEAVGEIVNVGSDDSIAILHLAARVASALGWNRTKYIPYAEAYGPHFEDTPARVPDLAKIQRLIGWHAEKPLDETIREVIEYERANL